MWSRLHLSDGTGSTGNLPAMSGYTKQQILERGHSVWAEVDLGAIRHNVAKLKNMAPAAELMGVVKGYAYGHGNPASAQAMLQAGASRLGVARVAEALHLRDAGVSAPIHVFTETPPEAVPLMIEAGLTPTVYSERYATSLSEAAASSRTTIAVHVKVDTGMHRVGLPADDVPRAISSIASHDNLEIEGVWSHLAVADVPDHPFTRKQLELFTDVVTKIERTIGPVRYKHIANSAATMSLPESHLDLVRCGVACFGLSPGASVDAQHLVPAMALRARVNMTKRVPAGEALSYGLSYELDRPGTIVTVPVGYADGYDRRLSGRADVLLAGGRHRVSGTVCMDQFMVDVGSKIVEPGATVTLLGRDGDQLVTAEELAALVGTINYEITTRVASRVPRLYLGETGE